ncbi:MAG: hypothetical protein ACREEM_23990 [Blastocatellia bacterium]
METQSLNGELIIRYLLGDLPEEEQARLEDQAFSDRELVQTIRAVESDLIDEYVRGDLSDAKRRQFERRFLASSERQQKVEFARALATVIPEATTKAPAVHAPISWWDSFVAFLRGLNPALQFSMAAAALMLALGVPWLIAQTIRLRAQVAQLQAERQTQRRQEEILQQQAAKARARGDDLVAQLEREREQRREELARQIERDRSRERPAGWLSIASAFLPPGIPRGDAVRPKLPLPRTARLARLQIGLERGDDYNRFRAELRTLGGQEVWSRDNLRAREMRAGRAVVLTLPASVLDAGEYELALKGVTDTEVKDLGYYYFDVLKK